MGESDLLFPPGLSCYLGSLSITAIARARDALAAGDLRGAIAVIDAVPR